MLIHRHQYRNKKNRKPVKATGSISIDAFNKSLRLKNEGSIGCERKTLTSILSTISFIIVPMLIIIIATLVAIYIDIRNSDIVKYERQVECYQHDDGFTCDQEMWGLSKY